MDKAFAGIRVLDFSTTIAGPHCTRLLADLGAEVIKIEPPEGEIMRSRPPLRNGASTSFGQLNAGKKSVVLDLKSPAAVAAIRTLAARADILVENFRPGVMQRLNIDYATLAPLNPRLIYCAISGFGQTGPSSQLPAYAPVVHAAAGYDMAHLRYQTGRTRPDYCGIFIADVAAGTYAFGAIAAALHHRHATGRGQLVDVSMLETMLSFTPLRTARRAIRCTTAGPADLRAARMRRRLSDGGGGKRKDLPGLCASGGPLGVDH
jgi:crotonobetainyl-CoA:carnitine CoA-transferase CaiB-like acyl-CoA transferase